MSLTVDDRNGIFVIRFSRPEIRNPLTTTVVKHLLELVGDVKLRSEIRRLIFTGTADVFASGADLREIEQLDPESAREFALRGQTLMNKVASISIPTVAAINGYCFGGGLDLALACKQRIASPDALFSHPGVGLGIITGWGGTQHLPRLIGEARALEMLITAGRFDSKWALSSGLVDEISEEPFERALAF
jgi:enoyl-CoA hydratase